MHERPGLTEEVRKRRFAADYRTLKEAISSSYAPGIWVGIADRSVVKIAGYLCSAMEATIRLETVSEALLWVQAVVKYRESIVIERAHDFEGRWFGYTIGMQTAEDLEDAFLDWDKRRKQPSLTSQEVMARLRRLR